MMAQGMMMQYPTTRTTGAISKAKGLSHDVRFPTYRSAKPATMTPIPMPRPVKFDEVHGKFHVTFFDDDER
jgi:hypothetical protein